MDNSESSWPVLVDGRAKRIGYTKLVAGPEMGPSLARDVMGWKRKWIRAYGSGNFLGGYFDSEEECKEELSASYAPFAVWIDERDQIGAWEHEWRPWGRMGQAWKIVKRLASKKKYEIRVCVSSDGHVSCIIHERAVDWCSDDYLGAPWEIAAHVAVETLDDAPLAICFAALEVCGHGRDL